jgi:hypothetical protein
LNGNGIVDIVVWMDIPLLHIGAGVAGKEMVANPFLETKTMCLDLDHIIDLAGLHVTKPNDEIH